MIWLTWRQFRIQVFVVAAVIVLLAVALTLTWTQVTDLARDTGFTGCQADACDTAANTFLDAVSAKTAGWLYYLGSVALFVLPILLGVFWGAPLVAREWETGTYRMVFSQSVSRRRWLLAKLAVGGVAAGLAGGLTSLVLTLWAAPIDRAGNRMEPLVFMDRGIVPIAYAALGFVIGVIGGLVLRRTLAAMAVTLLVVLVIQVAASATLLDLLVKPVTSVTAADPTGPFFYNVDASGNDMHVDFRLRAPLGAHILSRNTVTSTGAEFRGPTDLTKCPSDHEGPSADATCGPWLATQNLSTKITYVPGSDFWKLQWREFGPLMVLTLGLSGFSLWWIRRRLA